MKDNEDSDEDGGSVADDTIAGDDAADDASDDSDDTASDDTIDDDTATPARVPLRDGEGREIILHGANFMPIENDGQLIDYERMAEWGFNVVRIVISWRGLEPEQGVYDENYLPDIVEPQVEYADEAGLRVILNMHQYHWSPCCGGFGMPEWTCVEMGSPPVEWLWQSGRFFDNDDLVDGFVEAWEHVAEYFAGDDRVFAYDLFNEPIAGLRTLPWIMDDIILRPFYERLIDAIRDSHPEPFIVIEPTMATLLGLPFTMTPLDHERLIYSPHLYPGTLAEGGDYAFPRGWIEWQVHRRFDEAIEQHAPLLVGETGMNSSAGNAEKYARDTMDLFEESLAHWTWWIFHYDDAGMGLCDASGAPKDIWYRHLARPYPAVVAGTLHSFRFDTEARALTVEFGNAVGLSPALEIFVNAAYHYPEGMVVGSSDAEDSWSYVYDETSMILTVQCDPSAAEHTVVLAPAEG